jgi:hypothetical protein
MPLGNSRVSKVLVGDKSLLPYSGPFIKEQILVMQNWQAVLVGNISYAVGQSLKCLILTSCMWEKKLFRASSLSRLFSYWVTVGWGDGLRGGGTQLVHARFGLNAVDIWPLMRRLGLPMLVMPAWIRYQYQLGVAVVGSGDSRIDYPWRLLSLARHPDVHFITVSHAAWQVAGAVQHFGMRQSAAWLTNAYSEFIA